MESDDIHELDSVVVEAVSQPLVILGFQKALAGVVLQREFDLWKPLADRHYLRSDLTLIINRFKPPNGGSVLSFLGSYTNEFNR